MPATRRGTTGGEEEEEEEDRRRRERPKSQSTARGGREAKGEGERGESSRTLPDFTSKCCPFGEISLKNAFFSFFLFSFQGFLNGERKTTMRNTSLLRPSFVFQSKSAFIESSHFSSPVWACRGCGGAPARPPRPPPGPAAAWLPHPTWSTPGGRAGIRRSAAPAPGTGSCRGRSRSQEAGQCWGGEGGGESPSPPRRRSGTEGIKILIQE